MGFHKAFPTGRSIHLGLAGIAVWGSMLAVPEARNAEHGQP